MNYRIIGSIQILSAALFAAAQGNTLLTQRAKSSPDWNEALDDFKTLVHVITFGEEMPSHHSNPLQMLYVDTESATLKKNPFELPDGWFGNGKRKDKSSKKKSGKKSKSKKQSKKFKKNISKMQARLSSSELKNQQSLDDLALLNFLVQLEEPKTRSTVQMPKNKKHLSSLIMAENRYNEIKKKLSVAKYFSKKPSFSKSSNNLLLKSKSSKPTNDKKTKTGGSNGKKWYERIDAKGAKNTLTLSVAFGVIVTALFCVVVQLFKLFANPKGSGNGSAFDQINRRSAAYGYDRIALDIEEDEESAAQP